MMRKILLSLVILIDIFALSFWRDCQRFVDSFHFSYFDLSLRVIEAEHTDQGVPIFIVRAFHNKLVGLFFDLFKNYTRFWEIPFLLQLLSVVGAFGFILGIYYMIKKREWRLLCLILLLGLVQSIEIFSLLPTFFMIKIIVLVLLYQLVSLYGISGFLKKVTRIRVLTLLFVIAFSVWWSLILHNDIVRYCFV